MHVGAQKEQICRDSTLGIVGKFLGIDGFRMPNRDHPYDGAIKSAACKPYPGSKRTIVAVAYESDKDSTKRLVIALVDSFSNRVVASYQGEIGEDAAMRVESGSLWIDTAPYHLAKGVRALGLDVTSGYIPNCGDGGLGAQRTLYVQEGTRLRPVLVDLTMSTWSFLQRGRDRCTGPEAPETTIVERYERSIAVADTSTNGYRDLQITVTSFRDDRKKATRSAFRYKLRYDGRQYSTQDFEIARSKWESRAAWKKP